MAAVLRDAVLEDAPPLIVTCVHGTWARRQRWPELEKAITTALAPADTAPVVGAGLQTRPRAEGAVTFRYHEWSGHNSLAARTHAALALRQLLREEVSRTPHARHLLVAHSHGANIVLRALAGADPDVREAVAGVALLSPALLTCERDDDPRYVARRLWIGACVGLALLFWSWCAWLLTFGTPTRAGFIIPLVASAIVLVRLFPKRICRHAEALSAQLVLPAIDLPGLIIRAPVDEATTTLSVAAMASRYLRQRREQFLSARGFNDREDRRLREADTLLETFYAYLGVLKLPLVTFSLTLMVVSAFFHRQWLIALALALLEIWWIADTVPLILGSLRLVPVLAWSTLVLGAFGIVPSPAAVLLTVSLDSAPTPRWKVIELSARSLFGHRGWQHSTPTNPDAIAALAAYVGSRVRECSGS